MISSLITAIVATFIVLFITSKNDDKPVFLKVKEMFTKDNLNKTLEACKTGKALFVFAIAFISAFVYVIFF